MNDTRPAFTLSTPLYCRRCEQVAIVMPVIAVQNEFGEIHIIEVEEKGHYCMFCEGVRTVKEREPEPIEVSDTDLAEIIDPTKPLDPSKYLPDPPRRSEQHNRGVDVPVVVKRKVFKPTQQVACTECTWTNMARYLIDRRCPNCNGHVEEFEPVVFETST